MTRQKGFRLSDRAAASPSSAIRDLLSQAQRPGMISLAGGLPDESSFPTGRIAAIAARVAHDPSTLQYGETQGSIAARTALATRFDPSAKPEDIVVTTGSQQALDLIARVMVNPGDQVVVGDPDYLGALQVFRGYGAALHPIAVTRDGLNTDQLEHELQWGLRPKLCYLVPNFHNPTGSSISRQRRLHLADLAVRYGFLIVEDDPYRELFHDQAPDKALATTTTADDVTVRLRSVSKILAPGLRIGAAHAPPWLRDALVVAKQSGDLHTSTLSQAIVAEALTAPWFEDHLSSIRAVYRAKRDALATALVHEFGDQVEFEIPDGGMFIWARFVDLDNTAAWLQRSLDHGVCFVPGSAFAVHRDHSSSVRLSYATGEAADLVEGVSRMARARAEG